MYARGLLLFVLAGTMSISAAYQKMNTTVRPSASDKITAKSARSEFSHHGYDHHFPHHFGGGHFAGGHFGHYKEFEHYLLPMVVVIGLGVLFMPILSVLMTTLVGNVPVTTLVSGRKKRDLSESIVEEKSILELWRKVGKAIEVFSKED